jgi:NADP-dependent 3-hydroxy acid dehydrogenase YdfG
VTRPDHPQEGITLAMTTCNSRIDVLVNNAGVMLLGPSRSSSADPRRLAIHEILLRPVGQEL